VKNLILRSCIHQKREGGQTEWQTNFEKECAGKEANQAAP